MKVRWNFTLTYCLPLEALTLEFPRLLLAHRIWQMLLKPDSNQVGRRTEESNDSLPDEVSGV